MVNLKNFKMGILVLSLLVLTGCSTTETQEASDILTGNVIADTSDVVLASVNGEDIMSSEVEITMQMFMQYGQQVSEEEALEHIINQKVLSQKAIQEGYALSREELQIEIENQLSMQGMSFQEYEQQLSMQGINMDEQMAEIKEDFAIQEYLSDVISEDDIQVTEQEVLEFYEMYTLQSPEEVPPLEELEPQIIMSLEQQKEQEIIMDVLQNLRENSVIEYN